MAAESSSKREAGFSCKEDQSERRHRHDESQWVLPRMVLLMYQDRVFQQLSLAISALLPGKVGTLLLPAQ